MEGEGEQIEGDQQSGQVLLAVAEVVLEVVAIGFENVEGLVSIFLASGEGLGEDRWNETREGTLNPTNLSTNRQRIADP